jgi:ERCC4-type nuclease
MRIAVDTKEKKPWRFPDSVTTTPKALPFGDYALVSSSVLAVIERKSEQDLVNTLMHQADRFREELVQLAQADFGIVVVETDMPALERQRYRSKTPPNEIIDRVISLSVDWQVDVVWASTRVHAVRYASRWFARIEKRGG